MNELRYLDSLQGSGIRPGLTRMRRLLAEAGHPERTCPSIIVAGTNGKGSTASTLASILAGSGYRTGLYTSPHLLDIRERWTIDGRPVSLLKLRAAIRDLRSLERACALRPTYFEALTVLAFLVFREAACQVMVLEVGMGGRLDATNVTRPLAALITPVDIDHTEYLGRTLRAIAREKAGVIHRGAVALTSNTDPDVLEIIRRRAARFDIDLHETADEVRVGRLRQDLDSLEFSLRTPVDRYHLRTPLAGTHQVDNVSLAVRAAEEVRGTFPHINRESIEQGVWRARWRGRLERFSIKEKNVFVDSGHNAHAAAIIAPFASKHLPRPRLLVFGIMKDKNVRQVIELLAAHFDEWLVTEPPDSVRAMPAPAIAEILQSLGVTARTVANPESAIRQALSSSARSILIFGSLYLAGVALRILDRAVDKATTPRKTSDRNQVRPTRWR